MPRADVYLQDAFAAFDFGAPVESAERFGQGHINDTFVVRTQAESCRRFILQRISPVAFKRPDQLMENAAGITGYLARELEKTGGDAAFPPHQGRELLLHGRGRRRMAGVPFCRGDGML